MTDCSKCGQCCWPIISRDSFADICERGTWDSRFVAEYWNPISREVAMERAGPEREAMLCTSEVPEWYFFECAMYDPKTRECRAYRARPPICRHFPWYGGPPLAEKLIFQPDCSFWVDTGETL